jgi:hypothetical protein
MARPAADFPAKALPGGSMPLAGVSQFVNAYVEIFGVQHFLLLVLATPVFVAGAISDEKSDGTFTLLLTADLTSWEIVAGKMLGRMAQVGLLALAGLPMLCFMGGYGHLDWLTLLALPAVTAPPFFALAAASMVASVRSAQTRDAVLRVYLWGGLLILAAWGAHAVLDGLELKTQVNPFWQQRVAFWRSVLRSLNPLYVLEPTWTWGAPRELGWRMLAGSLSWGAVGSICLGLAVWRLRPAYVRQLEAAGLPEKRRWRGRDAEFGDDPIHWKERSVRGVAFLPWLRRVPRWLIAGAICGATLWLSIVFLEDPDPATLFLKQGMAALLLASLVTGIRASASISGERERKTWEEAWPWNFRRACFEVISHRQMPSG